MGNKANAPNWKKIKADYLAGKPIKDISKKHGVSTSAINSRRTREGWASDKADVAAKTRQKCIEKIAEKESSKRVQLMDGFEEAGLAMLSLLYGQIGAYPQGAGTKIVREIVKEQKVNDKSIPAKTVAVTDINALMRALSEFGRAFGLDAASKRAEAELRMENGFEETADDGFVEALSGVKPDIWVEDTPSNITDSAISKDDDDA